MLSCAIPPPDSLYFIREGRWRDSSSSVEEEGPGKAMDAGNGVRSPASSHEISMSGGITLHPQTSTGHIVFPGLIVA